MDLHTKSQPKLSGTMGRSAETDPFVSERRLVQVAAVVNAVVRSENWLVWETMTWLSRQAASGVLGPTLYMPPGTPSEEVHKASKAESLARWEAMARRAQRRKVDQLQMPSAASSWYMHADDLRAFAAKGALTPASKAALRKLAATRLKDANSQAESASKPDVQRIAGMKRRRSEGKSDREIAEEFGVTRQRVQQLIGSKQQNKIAENTAKRGRGPTVK